MLMIVDSSFALPFIDDGWDFSDCTIWFLRLVDPKIDFSEWSILKLTFQKGQTEILKNDFFSCWCVLVLRKLDIIVEVNFGQTNLRSHFAQQSKKSIFEEVKHR